MMFCKKKSAISIWSVIGFITAAVGVAALMLALFKCLKKHFGCFCGKEKNGCSCKDHSDLLSDLDLDLDCDDMGCTCPVSDENDMASDKNAVVNSENRMLNIENGK